MKKEDLLKTAGLAKLSLSKEESERFTDQLKTVLGYFHKISGVNTSQVEPLIHPLDGISDTENVRKDEVKEFKNPDTLLDLAPDRLDKEYKVPLVVE